MGAWRREKLNRLEEAVSAAGAPESWSTCLSACFELLHGLLPETEMAAGRFMAERYLPIFEAKHLDITWAGRLIHDVPGWHASHGRAVPDAPVPLDMADTAFQECLDALLYAHHHRADAASLAAAICCAVGAAVHARALNVWIADSPESVLVQAKIMEIGREGKPYPKSGPWSSERLFAPEHQPLNHAAYVAVAKREWASFSTWANAEDICRHADPEDPGAVARALQRWERHDFLLMRPEDPGGGGPPE